MTETFLVICIKNIHENSIFSSVIIDLSYFSQKIYKDLIINHLPNRTIIYIQILIRTLFMKTKVKCKVCVLVSKHVFKNFGIFIRDSYKCFVMLFHHKRHTLFIVKKYLIYRHKYHTQKNIYISGRSHKTSHDPIPIHIKVCIHWRNNVSATSYIWWWIWFLWTLFVPIDGRSVCFERWFEKIVSQY